MDAVCLRGLVKTFGTGEAAVRALRGISLTLPGGELAMIVGPSGCGKTTLVSVVAGILRPDAGTVQVLGEDFWRLSPRAQADFRARRLGFVFQSFNLLPALSVLENVAIPAILAGWSGTRARAAARTVLERVGLGQRLLARPRQLSGGQQQRVAIARAVVHAPDLVVCDEPTSALDHENGHAAMVLLRTLVADGRRSLVVVTHDVRTFGFADRIATMEDGHLVRIARRRCDPTQLAAPRPRVRRGDAELLADLAVGAA